MKPRRQRRQPRLPGRLRQIEHPRRLVFREANRTDERLRPLAIRRACGCAQMNFSRSVETVDPFIANLGVQVIERGTLVEETFVGSSVPTP